MEGGNLTHNLRGKKVSWYRKGKKVSLRPTVWHWRPPCLCSLSHAMLCMVQIALDVARALVYLHSRRILHLDIKSANVLLTRWVRHQVQHSVEEGRWGEGSLVQGELGVPASSPQFAVACRDGTAKVGDVGMAKIMAGDYVSGVVGTLAW